MSLKLHLISFGFRFGKPKDCDILFDVRDIFNPFHIAGEKSGLDEDVIDIVLKNGGCEKVIEITSLIDELIKTRKVLTICVGCKGGRHRSVAIIRKIEQILKDNPNVDLSVFHRDINS